MTQETINALIEVANELERLAAAVMIHTGVETASSVCNAAEHLKRALNKEVPCQN